jgi:hypothetical protein
MQDICSLEDQLSSFIKRTPANSVYRCRFNPLEDLVPIEIAKGRDQLREAMHRITDRYENRGFALFDAKFNNAGFEVVTTLAQLLHLGEPHIPPRYRNRDTISLYKGGINIISTHLHGRAINQIEKVKQPVAHAFTTANEQQPHVDGTLEEIGLIKTSILLCVSTPISGGKSIIFNSVAAFVELAERDIDAAVSLLDPRCLKRTDLDHGDSCTGPAFLIEGEDIFTRYSTDITSSWSDGLNNVRHLKRAYAYLDEMAKPGSPFFIETKLKPGQGLIMANHKVSHGRKSYIESQSNIRIMLRGIFFNYPSYDDSILQVNKI